MNGAVIRNRTLPFLVFLLFLSATRASAITHDWSQLMGGTGDSAGRTVAIDAQGNVLVGGDFRGALQFGPIDWRGDGTINDGFVIKFANDGTFLWATRLETGGNDTVTALAIDANDDVIAVGQLDRNVSITLLSGQNGSIRWQNQIGNDLASAGIGAGIASDGTIILGADFQGGIDFGGVQLDSEGSYDIALVAFDPAGRHLWSRRFGGGGTDQMGGLAASGSVIAVVGYFSGATDLGSGPVSSSSSDIFLATYSTNGGSPLWSRTFRGTGLDEGRTVDTTADGGFIIGGYFGQSGGSVDFGGGPLEQFGAADAFLASFSATGSFRWARSMGGQGDDFVRSVAVGPNDNIACVGYFQATANMGGTDFSSNGQFDAFLAEYNPNGQHRWSAGFGGAVSDRALAVRVGQETVMAGFTLHEIDFGGGRLKSDGFSDAFVAQFVQDGVVDDTPLPRSPTVTRTPTPTPSLNPPTPTETRSGTATRTVTRTATRTPTDERAATTTMTATRTMTALRTATSSATPAGTHTRTPTTTRTGTRTSTATRTATGTRTSTQTRTPTTTRTPSRTRTRTPTRTQTRTSTATRTITATRTPSTTRTGTRTRTPTRTGTPTRTDTATRTQTATRTATRTSTGTPTQSATITRTRTATPTSRPTASPTDTPPPTATGTRTVTRTMTPATSPASTLTVTPTPIHAATRTPTRTVARPATETPTSEPADTPSPLPSPIETEATNPDPTTTQEPEPTSTEPPPPTTDPAGTDTPEPAGTRTATERPEPSPTFPPAATQAPAATHTVAPSHTPATVESSCVGDCNGDSTVTLDELIRAINMALGQAPNGFCPLLDRNHDGIIAINEVIGAVGSALDGCASVVE